MTARSNGFFAYPLNADEKQSGMREMLTGFILVMTIWGNGDFVIVNTISDYKDVAACNEAKTALMQLVGPPGERMPHGLRAACIPGPEKEKF